MLLFALTLAASTSLPGVVGPGNETCRTAMTSSFRERSFDYIAGVWTGMNIAANKPVGRSTDFHEILKEVAKSCIDQPDLPLALAILAVHMRYEKQGR